MLYFVKRKDSTGSENAYVTENKDIVSKLGSRAESSAFKDISLKEVVARIMFEKPKIHTIIDKRFPGAIISKDVSTLENYLKRTSEMLKLDEYNTDRVDWEVRREKILQKLDNLSVKKNQ